MTNLSLTDGLTLAENEIDDIWENINRSPSDPVTYWISIATFTFAVLGFFSNLLTGIVLIRLSTQMSTFVYLTALSVSDMITCLSITFTSLLDFLFQRRFSTATVIFLRHIEILFGALAPGSRVLSLWISTAVTMDRWILICYPIYGKSFCTLKRAKVISLILFSIAFLYSIPLVFEYEIIKVPSLRQMIQLEGETLLDEQLLESSMLITKGYSNLARRRSYRWSYMFFNAIFAYTIPTAIILTFNIQLIRAIHRVKSRTKDLKQKHRQHKSRASRLNQSKYSVTIMVITLALTLLICRSPTIVIWILWSFEWTIKIFFDASSSLNIRRFQNTANLIAIINAATNFLPFCVFGQIFRTACVEIYCCQKEVSARRNQYENSNLLSPKMISNKTLSETTSSLNHSSMVNLSQPYSKNPSASISIPRETTHL